MKQSLRTLLCLCVLLAPGVKAGDPPSAIFVFGDSLSDTGNLAAFRDISLPLLPPFFPGPQPVGTFGLCNPVDIFILGNRCNDLFFMESRVSNGPVAVEILAERLGFDTLKPSLFFLPSAARPFVGTNYAVAGALAGGSELGDLGSQVSGFSVDHGFLAPSDALYVVMIGGNDVIDAVKAAIDLQNGIVLEPQEKPDAIINTAVDTIGNNISDLIDRGAKKFLVANSVNIASVPATRVRADAEGLPQALVVAIARGLTKKFNSKLAHRLRQIRSEQANHSIKIKKFNLFALFEGVRFVGRLFRLNIADACFDTDSYQDFSMLAAERNFHPDCAPDGTGSQPKFERFVFFDDLHPTGQVHAAIGRVLARAANRLFDD